LDYDSDHLPIAVAIDWRWQPATPTRKRIWAKTKIPVLRQTVEERLSRLNDGTELRNSESIDRFTSSIVEALDAGVEASTP